MKTIFRKAMTVLGSAALLGATVGAAAAAAYPAPFTSNTAIVVGANAAPSDSVAAASIGSDLDAASAGSMGGTTTVTGGDSYKFEKTSTKYHLGDTITSVISSSLDEDEMPILLEDGKYVDDDNDEFDFTQSITMAALQLKLFDDNDYAEDDPTVGFALSNGDDVLTYTLTFSDEPLIADMETTDLTLMGRDYYVLDAAYNSLTLLDSAADTILAEGETATLTAGGETYTVSISFISDTEAILSINGETTNSLSEGETYKLDSGAYVGLKDILYTSKESGVSKVEFSIGNGKLVLTSGSEVELNDESVDELTVTIVNNTASMSSITLDWDADDDLFIAEDSQAVMPGFGNIQLAFGGLTYPAEEEISIDATKEVIALEKFPLKDGEVDIPLLFTDGTNYVGIGGDTDKLLRTDNDGSITFDADTDAYFVVSWTDGRDAESYLMKAKNFDDSSGTNKTDFQYYSDGSWVDAKTGRQSGDTFSIGNAEVAVGTVNDVDKTVVVTNNSAQTNFNELFSEEGLKVYLPFNSLTSTASGAINLSASPTAWNLTMVEEDKDGDIAQGSTVHATLGLNSNTPKEPTVSTYYGGSDADTGHEIGDTDVYRNFVYSALATELLYDTSGDIDTLKLIYHGEEVAADVYITSSDASIVTDGESGVMTVTDDEVSSVSGKNLIVVGGSAINSVAAELLGGAYSEAEFTAMTNVAAGQFLIQSFNRNGKTALLVAGYHAADTTKAATYLVNNDVDTTVGKKYIGSAATEASLVVA